MATLTGAPHDVEEIAPLQLEAGQNLSSSAAPVRIALFIFVVFQFFYMLTSTGRVRTADEYNTLYMTESLVLRGSTAIPQAVQLHNFYGRFDLQGEPRAAYPPGQAVLCMPWYAFGQYVLMRLPGVPSADRDFVVWFSSCLSSATFSALTVMFFFLLLTGLGIPVGPSFLATALLGIATPVFAYSGWLFSEPLSAAIFMGVALLMFGRRSKSLVDLRIAGIAGVVLGLAVWVRPTNVLAIGVFAVAILARDRKAGWRAALVLCMTSAVGVLALLSRNTALFGSAFEFGYPKPVPGSGIDNSFDTPIATGLYGLLLSPGKSVFIFAPPIILAAAGLRRLWRMERGIATVATLFPAAYSILFAQYAHWEGGYCAGPRYLVPSIALFCIGLGPALEAAPRLVKKLAVGLLAVGAVVQCITLATSFLEDQAPARGHYYDTHWHYRFSYSLAGQIQIFLKYLRAGQSHKLGLGWDRWFVFLHVAGVSYVTLCVIGIVMVAGLIIGVTGLALSLRRTGAPGSVLRSRAV